MLNLASCWLCFLYKSSIHRHDFSHNSSGATVSNWGIQDVSTLPVLEIIIWMESKECVKAYSWANEVFKCWAAHDKGFPGCRWRQNSSSVLMGPSSPFLSCSLGILVPGLVVGTLQTGVYLLVYGNHLNYSIVHLNYYHILGIQLSVPTFEHELWWLYWISVSHPIKDIAKTITRQLSVSRSLLHPLDTLSTQ